MKKFTVLFACLCCSVNLHAFTNFIENPYTPYPPGCATLPETMHFYGDAKMPFYQGRIPLPLAYDSTQTADVLLTAFRIQCSDPDRSVIWFDFQAPDDVADYTHYKTPEVRAVRSGFYAKGVSLAREPNGWDKVYETWEAGQTFGGSVVGPYWGPDPVNKHFFFVLDSTAPFNFWFEKGSELTPSEYNGNFKLEINWRGGNPTAVIDVPSTASMFAHQNPAMPLNGRLSGIWGGNGASDQGFVISISELVGSRVPEFDELSDSPLLMFLSWYTFAADGKQLWLQGNANFPIGSSSVTIPIVYVYNGQFLGSKRADRVVAGSATITAINCNDLAFDYDLNDIGMGSETVHLHRILSLETAGYTCRDLESRIEANK